MAMTEILDEVVRLADRRRTAADAYEDARDSVTDAAPDADLFAALAPPYEVELAAYLNALPEPDVRRLHTLMYFGRGDDDLFSLEAHFAAKPDERVRDTLLEKLPLAEYLRSAVARAREAKIDLAAWWRGELKPSTVNPAPRASYAGPVFALSEPLGGADPLRHGGRLLHELAQQWTGDTVPLNDVDVFFSSLKAKTGGLVILDFIDLGSWDCFVGHEFDSQTKDLFLYWRDQRGDLDHLDRMAFPADLYGLYIRLHEIRIVRHKEFSAFLLQGVSTTPNEARKRLRIDASTVHVMNEDIFSSRVLRRVANMTHVIDVHGAPLYTIAIIPKGHNIAASASKRLLLSMNVSALETRLQRAIAALADLDLGDTDIISEKGNTIRRIVERALKIEIILRNVDVDKPYSQLLIGDLIGALRKHHEPEVRTALGKIAELANRFSHDTGTLVDLGTAQVLAGLAMMYVAVLRIDVAVYPRDVRRSAP